MNFGDVNGDGKYTVNDFLDMDNKEVLKENGGKKFDVIFMNPPYGNGTQSLYFDFVTKCLDISNNQITIMPFNIIKLDTKFYNKYKEKLNDYLYEVDEVDSNSFKDTSMSNCGIYLFKNIKRNNDIIIKYIDSKIKKIDSLFNIGTFSNYENNIVKYLLTNNINYHVFSHKIFNKENGVIKWFNKYDDNNIFLITNLTNGSRQGPWNPNFISNNTGQIFNSKKEAINGINKYHKACNFMIFKNIKAAENCKLAMKRPLLRFTLLRTQVSVGVLEYCYKYIPDIDWSDDIVKTDEGLLEVCGCPKDKCKEYADYCKKVIEEVDRKK